MSVKIIWLADAETHKRHHKVATAVIEGGTVRIAMCDGMDIAEIHAVKKALLSGESQYQAVGWVAGALPPDAREPSQLNIGRWFYEFETIAE